MLDETLAPLATTPDGAAAVAELKTAIAHVVTAAEAVNVDWSSTLTGVLPKLVKLSMGIRA